MYRTIRFKFHLLFVARDYFENLIKFEFVHMSTGELTAYCGCTVCVEYKIIICNFSWRTKQQIKTQTQKYQPKCLKRKHIHTHAMMHNPYNDCDKMEIQTKQNFGKSMCILWYKLPRRRYATYQQTYVNLIKFYGFHCFNIA